MLRISKINQLNMARGARRHPPAVWLLLLSAVSIMGLCLYVLAVEYQLLDRARAHHAQLARTVQRDIAALKRQEAERGKAESVEKEKLKQQIREVTRMSWDGVFDTLEVAADAVRGGATILALTPSKVEPNTVQFSVTALAANIPMMLAYIEAIKKDPRVVEAELLAQQPEPKAGANVVRFQANFVLDPRVVPKKVVVSDGDASNGAIAIVPADILKNGVDALNPRSRR